MIRISSEFDAGNIECVSCDNPANIELNIRKDNQSDFYQWFYFRLTGANNTACTLHLLNASGAAYAGGWENYNAVASYDRDVWFRVPTRYKNDCLTIDVTPDQDSMYFAYFAPYSLERHSDLISHTLRSSLVQLNVLGSTVDGRDIECLTIGENSANKKHYWAIARQHPGETMAEWWMEGFLDRLLDEDDAVSRALLENIVFHVVPNMNPDGSFRGHLRTNAVGANLNREWAEPSEERSPEVFYVRREMERAGVDFCLDVHGDETLPYNFIAGTEGIEQWNDARNDVLIGFKKTLQTINPDFQIVNGYPPNLSGKANLSFCSNNIAHSFDCLAMTLEMPFKDTADTPQPDTGWSPERARALGASCLQAIYAAKTEFD